jgi:hypothetical protein
MIAIELGTTRVDEALRVVRALGAHRYVASRLHLVHAFAWAAIGDEAPGVLADGLAWARAALCDASVDMASRDERAWRRSSDAEVAAVLEAFWTPGPRSRAARGALRATLERHDLASHDHAPFDESVEDVIHPIAIDAGWELLSLSQLDPERHKGAISAFGDALAFESACFEEETEIPRRAHLVELPGIGPVELLRGADDEGTLAEPLVIWAQGNATYLDYVVRGVRRAAKLELPPVAGR